LETHARRIFAVAVNRDATAAKALAKKIIAGAVNDGFALRDVYRSGWSHLSSREDTEGAVRLLLDLDWLRQTTEPTGGAPRTQYWISPKVSESLLDGADKTARSRQEADLSVLSGADEEPSELFGAPEDDGGERQDAPFDVLTDGDSDEEILEWSA